MFQRDINNGIMESNQLGKSIVKAAWIVSVAIIVCMIMYVSNNKNIYTNVGGNWYINQKTGLVHNAVGEYDKQTKGI